jgi:hypothetical protein
MPDCINELLSSSPGDASGIFSMQRDRHRGLDITCGTINAIDDGNKSELMLHNDS